MRAGWFGPLALSALAGLAQAASIAQPWNDQPAWGLQLLSLAVLAALVHMSPDWRAAALRGWVFATAWLAGCWWWLFISMHVYGGLAAPVAAIAVLLLAGFLGLYYALAAWLAWRLGGGERGDGLVAGLVYALVFGAAWLLAELLRGVLFTGFPWGAGAYAHVDGPLAGLAPWVGAWGMGFAAAVLAALLSRVRRPYGLPVLALALLALVALVPSWRGGASAGSLSVALLQGNIAQDEKFEGRSGVPQALAWYGEQLAMAPAQLVVAPETAIPLLPQQLPPEYMAALGERFRAGDRAALMGIPLGSYEQGYTNSVIGLAPGATDVYRYDKHHLVPFGEFIPPLFRWFTDLMNIPLGDFNRGAVGQPSFEWRGQRLAANVCYEDLFGEELGARFRDEASAPTMFVNVSNIAWFGDTVAIAQHLQISRMRALEFSRPMIRATNTGATAVVDHRGRVTAQLPRLTRGVLQAQVEGRTGLTPYARWVSAAGLWPVWALALAILLAAALRLRVAARALGAPS